MAGTSKRVLPLAVAAAIVVLAAVWTIATYNGMVQARQAVDAQWAQVESVYQRRVDLVPNLVAATQAYLIQEREVLQAVLRARESYAEAPPRSTDRVEAADRLDKAIGQVLAVIERYPDLRSRDVVLGLMDELAGTENRIAVERRRYNERVRQYNGFVLGVPRNLIAKAAGFRAQPYFRADLDAASAPKVP